MEDGTFVTNDLQGDARASSSSHSVEVSTLSLESLLSSPTLLWDQYRLWVHENYDTIQSIEDIVERIWFWIIPYTTTTIHPMSRIVWSVFELHRYLVDMAIRQNNTINLFNDDDDPNPYGMSIAISPPQQQQNRNNNNHQKQNIFSVGEIKLVLPSPSTVRFVLSTVHSLWPIVMELTIGMATFKESRIRRQQRRHDNEHDMNEYDTHYNSMIIDQYQSSIRCYIERIRFGLRLALLASYWNKFHDVIHKIRPSSLSTERKIDHSQSGILPGIMLDGGSLLVQQQHHHHQQNPQYTMQTNFDLNHFNRRLTPHNASDTSSFHFPTIEDERRRIEREQYIGKRTGRRIVNVSSPSSSSLSSTISPYILKQHQQHNNLASDGSLVHDCNTSSSSLTSSTMDTLSKLGTLLSNTVSKIFVKDEQSNNTSTWFNKGSLKKMQVIVGEVLYIVRPLIQAEMHRIVHNSSSIRQQRNNSTIEQDIQQHQRLKQKLLFRTWLTCLGMDVSSLFLLNNAYSSSGNSHNSIMTWLQELQQSHRQQNYPNTVLQMFLNRFVPSVLQTQNNNKSRNNTTQNTTCSNTTRQITYDELKRRQMRLVLYLLRCPIWDRYTKPVVDCTTLTLEYIPLLGRLLANYLWDYIQYYKYYQCEEG